jgi:hypothetical protein
MSDDTSNATEFSNSLTVLTALLTELSPGVVVYANVSSRSVGCLNRASWSLALSLVHNFLDILLREGPSRLASESRFSCPSRYTGHLHA